MERERRALQDRIEVRAEAGSPPKLVGYAARFNSKSLDLGGFVEVIRPGAFRRVLANKADVRALVDHDSRLIIGRTKADPPSLLMEEDDLGLRVEIMPPATGPGRDVLENVRNGNLDGMSFSFMVKRGQGDRWDFDQTPALREILDVHDLFDVSVVAFPAYPKTDVAVRSMEDARREWEAEQAKRAERMARIERAERSLRGA